MRIVLIDGSREFIDVLVEFFAAHGEHEVVGTARTAAEALAMLAETPFDVALVDYVIPGMDGFEIVRRMKAARSASRAVILTAFAQDVYITQALAAGAEALVSKDRIEDDLLPLLRRLSSE